MTARGAITIMGMGFVEHLFDILTIVKSRIPESGMINETGVRRRRRRRRKRGRERSEAETAGDTRVDKAGRQELATVFTLTSENGGGRPTTLSPEIRDAIVSNVGAGATLEVAAAARGVPPKTVRNWIARGTKSTEHPSGP